MIIEPLCGQSVIFICTSMIGPEFPYSRLNTLTFHPKYWDESTCISEKAICQKLSIFFIGIKNLYFLLDRMKRRALILDWQCTRLTDYTMLLSFMLGEQTSGLGQSQLKSSFHFFHWLWWPVDQIVCTAELEKTFFSWQCLARECSVRRIFYRDWIRCTSAYFHCNICKSLIYQALVEQWFS
jgi:hypothetical protein